MTPARRFATSTTRSTWCSSTAANDLYLPVLRLLEPRLARGALVAADMSPSDPHLDGYRKYVGDVANGYRTVEVGLDDGVVLSARAGG